MGCDWRIGFYFLKIFGFIENFAFFLVGKLWNGESRLFELSGYLVAVAYKKNY